MERYETARIDVTQIEEDVIAASVTGCRYEERGTELNPEDWYIVSFSDGTTQEHELMDLPDEYVDYCF